MFLLIGSALHWNSCQIWMMFPGLSTDRPDPLCLQLTHRCCQQTASFHGLTSNADCFGIVFKSFTYHAFKEDVEQVWWEQTSVTDPDRCMEPVSYGAFHKYCTAGLCIQLFGSVDQLLAHVVLLKCSPQCTMALYETPPWSQRKHGGFPADVGYTFCTELQGWISALWCSFFCEILPALHWWPLLPEVSVSSEWTSVSLCLFNR